MEKPDCKILVRYLDKDEFSSSETKSVVINKSELANWISENWEKTFVDFLPWKGDEDA